MDSYVTGSMIKKLREERKMTQAQLAEKLGVSDKAVSKWETGRGFPDISLLESLSGALRVSPIELLSGQDIRNTNRSSNLLRSVFYVCPVCGNVIWSTGNNVVSCCGIQLPALEVEETEDEHEIIIERIDGEYYAHMDHPMTKNHSISFMASVSDGIVQLTKLYPEGPAEARFRMNGVQWIYAYCRHHGLFRKKVSRRS